MIDNMKFSSILFLFIFSFIPSVAYANIFEDLCKDGYAVVKSTYISDEFNGCEYDKTYQLDNGMIFYCTSYSYSYSYRPEFYILKNIFSGSYKYIINDQEYDGYVK